MCCKSLWKKLVPFAIALMLGILAASLFQRLTYSTEDKTAPKLGEVKVYSGGGGGGRENGKVVVAFIPRAGTNPVQIISKSRPNYTLAARENNVQGTVRLRVTFLESGQIGEISPVEELPHGLTEEAIKAAEKIKFQPATVDGKAVTVKKTVEYSFTIY